MFPSGHVIINGIIEVYKRGSVLYYHKYHFTEWDHNLKITLQFIDFIMYITFL